MKTGWTRRPSKLSDRVDEDNNTLFETWTSNVAKMDMSEAECIALRNDIKSVRLSRPHLYDPSKAVPPEQMLRRSADVVIANLTADDVAAQSPIMSVEVDAEAVQQGQGEEVQEGEAAGVEEDEMEEDQGDEMAGEQEDEEEEQEEEQEDEEEEQEEEQEEEYDDDE
jgi:hypothetical protein